MTIPGVVEPHGEPNGEGNGWEIVPAEHATIWAFVPDDVDQPYTYFPTEAEALEYAS